MNHNHDIMQQAIRLSLEGIQSGRGGPFGAIVVKDGVVVGRGSNAVTSTNDPTAHAEVVAIRDACKNLGSFQLDGCDLYTSCEPCPMCLSAIYWARIEHVCYSNTRNDAKNIGFDDEFIYDELKKEMEERKVNLVKIDSSNSLDSFTLWENKTDKIFY
jgi:tRNA(Arg) A34 adenosine deaminase TadA